jgi:hypothetical protein
LTERWSYKPEVEGLSPSLGTRIKGKRQKAKVKRKKGALFGRPNFFCLFTFSFCLGFSGRDSSQQNGDCAGPWSSEEARRPHAPANSISNCRFAIADRSELLAIVTLFLKTNPNSGSAIGNWQSRIGNGAARVPGVGLLNRT